MPKNKIIVLPEQFAYLKEEVCRLLPGIEELTDWLTPQDERVIRAEVWVSEAGIRLCLPWHNEFPPLLFPTLSLEADKLLSYILIALGAEEKTLALAGPDSPLIPYCQILYTLKHGGALGNTWQELFNKEEDYLSLHNRAVILHYAPWEQPPKPDLVEQTYLQAIEQASSWEDKAFSAKHLASYWADIRKLGEAERLLFTMIEQDIPPLAKHSLLFDYASIGMGNLRYPYADDRVQDQKERIAQALQAYQIGDDTVYEALLLVDASEIANIEENFAESLTYINRAIQLFEAEAMEEFQANAFWRKGTLLFTWAQKGNPQFFQAALESYQEALKYFHKETHPAAFAEIHQHLGVIYSELPAENKKRAIWAALSATSFQEALAFFQKESHPYEYAMICNNYANALLNYPPSRRTDNLEKALHFYQEALEIRDSNYPMERSITILNYLEACWKVQNLNPDMEKARLADMQAKAMEVLELTEEAELLAQVQLHLEHLKSLSETIF